MSHFRRTLVAATLLGSVAAPAFAVTEIPLSHQLDEARIARLQEVVDRFNNSQKDYHVVPVRRSEQDAPAVLNLAVSEDISLFSANRGGFRPIADVMKEAKERMDTSSFLADYRGPLTEGNKLMALPVAFATPVLYYNKAAFKKAGLNPDQPPKTWWEVQNAAGKLVDAGSSCAYTTSWPAWVLIENASARNGAPAATASGTFAFNGLAQVKQIALLTTWYKSKYFTYFGRRNEADAKFAAGECGMLTSGSDIYATLKSDSKVDLGVAPMPYFDDAYGAPQRTLAGGGSLWIGAGKKAAEYKGAAKFVSFITAPDMQIELAKAGGFLPLSDTAWKAARSKLLKDDLVNQEVAHATLAGRADKDAIPARISFHPQVRLIVEEELEAVWKELKTPKEALDTAVARANAVVRSLPKGKLALLLK